ncbi:MAG: DegT/DnrJ/EryC1/StrS family aminotransferase, partial [Candidatus Micrarchaeota archaeon]
SSISAACSKKTRAVIVPSLFGQPAEWKGIKKISGALGVFAIDDAAQSFGASYSGTQLGCFGDAGVHSFNLGKMISATGGGFLGSRKNLAFDSQLPREKPSEVFSRAASVFLRGRMRGVTLPFFTLKDEFKRRFVKARHVYRPASMSNLDASLCLVQLGKLDEIIRLRRRNAAILQDCLEGVEGLVLPERSKEHVYTNFVVTLDRKKERAQASTSRCSKVISFARFLHARGVETEWHYVPLHLREPFRRLARIPKNGLLATESQWWRCIGIPVNPLLGEEQMKHVGSVSRKFFSHSSIAVL